MDPETKEKAENEMRARFELLPEDIRNVITSSDYQMQLFELAKKYKLTYEQLGSLEFETTTVLLGVSDPKDYLTNVAEALHKKPEELAPIVEEIKQQVFTPIRASLIQLYESGETETTTPVVATPAPSQTQTDIFAKSGISIDTGATPASQTISAPMQTENRADMLKAIENPAKSTPVALNETKPTAFTASMPLTKSPGLNIPVPMAPYAGGAPTADAVKKEIPMTAAPTGDIMAGKLGGTFAMPAKQTDYSLKPTGATPATPAAAPSTTAPGKDAYREPIE